MRLRAQPELINTRDAAKFLGMAWQTLAKWRCQKSQPLPYRKVGKKIYYDVEDLLTFLDECKVSRVEVGQS